MGYALAVSGQHGIRLGDCSDLLKCCLAQLYANLGYTMLTPSIGFWATPLTITGVWTPAASRMVGTMSIMVPDEGAGHYALHQIGSLSRAMNQRLLQGEVIHLNMQAPVPRLGQPPGARGVEPAGATPGVQVGDLDLIDGFHHGGVYLGQGVVKHEAIAGDREPPAHLLPHRAL